MSDQTQFDQPSWQTRDVYNIVVNAAEFASEERARSYLRMLAVLSAPVANERGDDRPDGRVLDVWGEWERLRQATDQARDPVSGQGAPWAVVRLVPPTAEALRRALTPHDPGYQVLHFSCHGSPAGLTLEDKLGCERLLSAADLVAALRGTPIRLVVLNACATAELGRTLVEAGGVPCVIATREPIDDRESKLLSEQLYGYLAAGATVGQALEHARREIAAQMQRGELPVPGSPTERAANLLLFGDGELRLAAEGDPARAPCFILHPVPHNHPLPFEPITGFVGRSRDLLELARWFAAPDRRFFALCGVGGMGKTSLALNAALRHFWRFRALAFASAKDSHDFGPLQVLLALKAALGTPIAPGEDSNLPGAIARCLNGQAVLLILDNLESLTVEQTRGLAQALDGLDPQAVRGCS